MIKMSSETGKTLRNGQPFVHSVLLLLVVASVSLLFAWSVQLRQPWFGQLSREGHQWLTGSTMKFVQNWLKDDPWKIRFMQLENPASIELPTLLDREPYVSYPSGTIIPVYLASYIRGHRVGTGVVMGINLLNQLGIALILSITTFLLLRERKVKLLWTIALSILPGAIYTFLPGNMYWHQNVYYSDQAVILPFIGFICLEVLRFEPAAKNKRIFDLLQGFVALYGASVDYLFLVMGFVVLCKRLILGQFDFKKRGWLGRLAIFGLPFLAGPAFFVYQLAWSGTFGKLKDMFFYRTALSEAGVERMGGNFFQKVWGSHLDWSYGQLGRYVLWVSILVFIAISLYYLLILRKKETDRGIRNLIVFAGLVLIPCLLQTYALRNHSFVHSFSVLKYSVFMAVFPFVLLPVIVDSFKIFNHSEEKVMRTALYTRAVLYAVLFLLVVTPGYVDRFYAPSGFDLEIFINDHTGYEEIVFSPGFEIKSLPPQPLAMSEKLVHKYECLSEVLEKIEKIPGDFPVMFLIDEDWATPQPDSLDDLAPIIAQAEASYRKDSYWLHKIMKSDLVPLIEP